MASPYGIHEDYNSTTYQEQPRQKLTEQEVSEINWAAERAYLHDDSKGRNKFIHLMPRRSDSTPGVYHVTEEKGENYVFRYMNNVAVFYEVTDGIAQAQGWLYHSEIVPLMIASDFGGWDVTYPPLRPMSTYRRENAR